MADKGKSFPHTPLQAPAPLSPVVGATPTPFLATDATKFDNENGVLTDAVFKLSSENSKTVMANRRKRFLELFGFSITTGNTACCDWVVAQDISAEKTYDDPKKFLFVKAACATRNELLRCAINNALGKLNVISTDSIAKVCHNTHR